MCGGGGGGVDNTAQIEESTQTVVDKIDDTAAAAGTQMQGLGSQIGTASETGTTTAAGGTMTTPVSTVVNEDGTTSTVGGEEVAYGGGEVAVTDSVKGDTEALLGGQSDLSAQIDTGFSNIKPTTVVTQQIDTSDLAKTGEYTGDFADVGTKLDGLGSGQGELKQGQTNILAGQDALSTGIDDVSGQVTNLSSDTQKGFTDATADRQRIADNVSAYLKDQFGLTTDQITKLSQDVLSGQTSLKEIVENIQGKQTSQFADIMGGQEKISGEVGGMQTGLDEFRDKYNKDATAATQERTRLSDQVVGGFEDATAERLAQANVAARDTAKIIDATQGQVNGSGSRRNEFTGQVDLSGALSGREDTSSQPFASTAATLADGGQPNSAMLNQFLSRIYMMKNSLTDSNANLDPQTRATYTLMANAFDEGGRLIPTSYDANNNRQSRAIDKLGNLNVGTFNAAGQRTTQQVVNIDQALQSLNTTPGGLMGASTTGSPFA
jgi:hypothetical protein